MPEIRDRRTYGIAVIAIVVVGVIIYSGQEWKKARQENYRQQNLAYFLDAADQDAHYFYQALVNRRYDLKKEIVKSWSINIDKAFTYRSAQDSEEIKKKYNRLVESHNFIQMQDNLKMANRPLYGYLGEIHDLVDYNRKDLALIKLEEFITKVEAARESATDQNAWEIYDYWQGQKKNIMASITVRIKYLVAMELNREVINLRLSGKYQKALERADEVIMILEKIKTLVPDFDYNIYYNARDSIYLYLQTKRELIEKINTLTNGSMKA